MYEHRGYSFKIGRLQTENLYAYSGNTPMFYLLGDSQKDCEMKARRAIDAYIRNKPKIDEIIKNK